MLQPWFASLVIAAALASSASAQGVLFGTKVEELPEGKSGVKVLEVTPSSPAAGAGVEIDDVIVKMGDVKIKNLDDFTKFLDDHKVGDVVAFGVVRGGKGDELALKATLGKMVPGAAAKAPKPRKPAKPVRVAPAPEAEAGPMAKGVAAKRTYLGVTSDVKEGTVTVVDVVPETPAARAGLRAEDQILSMDGKALSSPEDLRAAIRAKKPGDKANLVVVREDGKMDVVAILGEAPDEEAVARSLEGMTWREMTPKDGNVLVAPGIPSEAQAHETVKLHREIAELRAEIEVLKSQLAEMRAQLKDVRKGK
jgi:S1-C subfamily serine protease